MTDRELLDRLHQGDRDAFDAVFRAHYATLVGVAERIVGERAVAEELAQDVMLELWRRHETLHVDESLRAYLVRAARNRALNHLRHERMVVRTAPRAAGETVTQPDAPGSHGASRSRSIRSALPICASTVFTEIPMVSAISA